MRTKPIGRLTPRQNYLLQRLPAMYQMSDGEKSIEPVEVKKARKVIEQWDKREALRQCRAKERNRALVEKARESIYFDDHEKALVIIRQCEKLLKGCPA